MRLRDTTGVAPVRRLTVARGRLALPPGTGIGPDEVAAARAAALAAVKDATRLLPTGTPMQVTDAFCDVEVADAVVGVTLTLQGWAREPMDSAGLLGVAAALVSVRDALNLHIPEALLERIEIVQSVNT